jgi:ABC-type bacteriocin/lantibiotic exporter with double-glycine peptidase domain
MMANAIRRGRRLFAAEVVQTSAMDCGPAALTCLLEGFGIHVSYGRLREACQTDVDGTSIDTLEEAAVQLGLEAEQVIVPVDHLLLPEAAALPALIVVRLASGFTHFVVAWRRHGRVVQVMDPATGRRWPTCRSFLNDVYVHTMPIPTAAWRAWAETHECLGTLRRRLAHLGIGGRVAARATAAALADPDWGLLAILDATTRMVHAMVRAGGLRRGPQATGVFEAFFERAQQDGPAATQTLPEAYWTVRPAPPGPDGEACLLVRGAVLVRVRGRRPPYRPPPAQAAVEDLGEPAPLSPELVAALAEPPRSPGRELLRLLRADGLLAPTALVAALFLAAGSIVVEVLLLRGLFDLGRNLGLVEQRLGAMVALLVFVAALLLLELPIAAGLFRLGRHLEVRLRQAFLEKIPRLNDRYFQSRPTSDMAERSHSIHQLRLLPDLGGQLLRLICEIALMTAGIAWLDPLSAPVAVLAALVAVGLPLAVRPLLTERDLRVRTHVGALSRFYLDTLLGLVAVRTHGAERAVQREHESLLVEWAGAGFHLQRTVVAVEGVQSLLGFGLAAWLLLGYLARGGDASGVLLLAYWGLNLPVLGQEIALLIRQYPMHRNVTLRLLEPLGALEDSGTQDNLHDSPPHTTAAAPGVCIALEGVSVRAAGHTILTDIDLAIEAGSHVAIVGPSGAGKSSLVGLLLGWHRAVTGHMLVDGVPLDGRGIEQLRQETAWVDPAVQLWNRSLLDNLRYGGHGDSSSPLATVIEQAELRSILEKLPAGLQTPLGEGGGLVSGGEGQRVRFGRALMRPGVRLVILDEPFRGLDRAQRRELLARVCRLWRQATLLCITHDVGATQAFERVLVVEAGRIVEHGAPADLAACPDSRYRAMLEAEGMVQEGLWSSGMWRRLWLENGRLGETCRHEDTSCTT